MARKVGCRPGLHSPAVVKHRFRSGTLHLCHAWLFSFIGAVDELVVVDSDSPGNRFNDGKCDAVGRLWCGTMGDANPSARKKGSLFSYSAGMYSYNTCVYEMHSKLGSRHTPVVTVHSLIVIIIMDP